MAQKVVHPESTYDVIELIGTSAVSWEESGLSPRRAIRGPGSRPDQRGPKGHHRLLSNSKALRGPEHNIVAISKTGTRDAQNGGLETKPE